MRFSSPIALCKVGMLVVYKRGMSNHNKKVEYINLNKPSYIEEDECFHLAHEDFVCLDCGKRLDPESYEDYFVRWDSQTGDDK